MRIGFVSTWFERGAAYVTRSYIELLQDNHEIFIYARGGEAYGKDDPNWDKSNVTWAPTLMGTNINFHHFKKWISKNKIDTIFFNEQHDNDIIYKIKMKFPEIKIGSYIDYYKEDTVNSFFLYDFLICNTKRHYSVFKNHPQCYYVPWGTSLETFYPMEHSPNNELTFFHSAGMSERKGTNYTIEAFIKGELYEYSKLIIHTQSNFEKVFGYKEEYLKKYNIELIIGTVPAPGLYHLGDVYVYPTTLDGLGLTMYEALACGMPVITTDHPPMNEVINDNVGKLVEVDYFRSRSDAYYWPLSIVSIDSLIDSMRYFLDEKKVEKMKLNARNEAVELWNWKDRKDQVNTIFTTTQVVVDKPNSEYLSDKNIIEMLTQTAGSTYLYSYLKTIKRFKRDKIGIKN